LAVNHGLHQGRAFALFGFCTALGTLIGPLLGGFLSQPAEKYGLVGPGDIFKIYPYLLPCLIGGVYNLVIVALSVLYLPETNLEIKGKPQDAEGAVSEESPLIPQDHDGTAKEAPRHMTSLVVLMLCYLSVISIALQKRKLLTQDKVNHAACHRIRRHVPGRGSNASARWSRLHVESDRDHLATD
jgi:MFS family permease